jgi:large subunit ribosomal protein L9
MEIILTKDVTTLGLAGQVVKVAPGYARNYLLPGSMALPATPSNLRALAKTVAEFEHRAKAAKDSALEIKASLSSLVLTIARKSGEKGKLYGAVTAQDLVDQAAANGVTLDRKRLRLSEPIKTLGDFEVGVRLHPEVTGIFRVKVIKEGSQESAGPEDTPPGSTGRAKASPQEEGPSPEKASGEIKDGAA